VAARERVEFPLRRFPGEVRWVEPSYHQVHSVLTSPVYAGAYAYGKTRRERYVDEQGVPRKRVRLPREEWGVLLWDHHPGFLDREAFERNKARIARNTRPRAHEAGGAIREGQALLQGIAVCGRCGRKLKVHYQGRRGHQSPAYHCPGAVLDEGRGKWCLRVGGSQIDEAVAEALLQALTPAGVSAALRAAEALRPTTTPPLPSGGCSSSAPNTRPSGPSARQVEPEHRLVARGLEREWEQALSALHAAESELELRQRQRPRTLTAAEREQLLGLAQTSGAFGRRPPPATATASSSCAA
jgi:Recombinase zinc beta ribbon domain/Recombinase